MKYKNGKVLKLARTGSRINEQLSDKKIFIKIGSVESSAQMTKKELTVF